MNSSDSAEEIIKISLDGMEMALKIAGNGAKNLAVMIYTIMKNKQQTKGKTRLTNMLKTGKTLKIFTIKSEDLKTFSKEAKKYGVLYCALADKKNAKIDGMVDIMVREEDASRINRIAERFNFADIATIEKELHKEKENISSTQDKSKEEIVSQNSMKKGEQQELNIPSNHKNSVEKNQLENFSNTKPEENWKIINSKKSVREELKQIEKEWQKDIQSKQQKTKKQTKKQEKYSKGNNNIKSSRKKNTSER